MEEVYFNVICLFPLQVTVSVFLQSINGLGNS